MDLTIEDPDIPPPTFTEREAGESTTRTDIDALPPDEADEIRGMMPTFNVWQEAQHTLKFERAAATVARERERSAARKKRWPVIAVACTLIAGAVLVQRMNGDGDKPLPTATTPVDELPWHVERPGSKAFRVSMPADASSHAISTAAGTGEEIEAQLPQITIRVGAIPVSGPSQARALVDPLLRERAEALDGALDRVQGVGTRAGAGFESIIRAATPVGIVRVIIDGSMMYVIELRGDIDTPRTRQIYDRVVLSFTAGG
jgi:hypothetical protein